VPGAAGFGASMGAKAFSGMSTFDDDDGEDDLTLSSMVFLLFVVAISSGALAAVLTYTGIKGELPPLVLDAAELPRVLLGRLTNGAMGAYARAPGFRDTPSTTMPPAPDWTWAHPPRSGQQPTQPPPGNGGEAQPPPQQQPAPPPASYGGV
jgi:hypothetical protein